MTAQTPSEFATADWVEDTLNALAVGRQLTTERAIALAKRLLDAYSGTVYAIWDRADLEEELGRPITHDEWMEVVLTGAWDGLPDVAKGQVLAAGILRQALQEAGVKP